MKIRAAVLREGGQPFTVEELELEEPRNDEVLVRVVATGMCHTDLSELATQGPLPIVLGHEGAGIVERIGDHVTKVRPGDHVILSSPSCGSCRNCLRALPAYCASAPALKFSGARPDGSVGLRANREAVHSHYFGQSSFATHALASQRTAVKVPSEIPLEQLGPLGCGVQTGAGAVLNVLRPPVGSSIAVFGTGAVGLSAVMAAIVAGCTTIIAVDVKASRLALARELGATHTLNPAEGDVVDAIRQISGGGVDYALDTSGAGSPAVVSQAVESLAALGTCGLVGGAPAGMEVTLQHWTLFWGRSVRGIIQGDSNPDLFIPTLIALHTQGRFPFDRLLAFYPLDEINEAAAASTEGHVVKPVIRMSPSVR